MLGWTTSSSALGSGSVGVFHAALANVLALIRKVSDFFQV